MKRLVYMMLIGLLALIAVGSATAQDTACNAELQFMTTPDGIEFVRTPDACFENLPDWTYEPQYLEIDGLRQAYVDVGPADGEVILLLHGQPSWSYLYRKMIPVLADAGYRVIAMDHLGMGRSDKPIDPDDYTYLGHTARLEAFITELELTHITVFVQDWGSLIGLYVVGTNPEWFDRVVIGNGFLPTTDNGFFPPFENGEPPFPLPENTAMSREMFYQTVIAFPPQQPFFYDENFDPLNEGTGNNSGFGAWIDFARNDERFVASDLVEALTYYDLTPEEEAAYDAPFPTRITMGGARAFPGLANTLPGITDEGWAGLGEFEKPVLTIWGGNDPGELGPKELQEALIEHIPGATGWSHERLREASHFLQDDQGALIAERIIEFIELTPGETETPMQTNNEILSALSETYSDPEIDPSAEAWAELLAHPGYDDAPIVFLEIAALDESDIDTARAQYNTYLDALLPAIEQNGGELILIYDIEKPGTGDLSNAEGELYSGGVAYTVRYPSRAALIASLLDDAVVDAVGARHSAVVATQMMLGTDTLPPEIATQPKDVDAADIPTPQVDGKSADQLLEELMAIYPDGGADATYASIEDTLNWDGFEDQPIHFLNLYDWGSKGEEGARIHGQYTAAAQESIAAHGSRAYARVEIEQVLVGPYGWDRLVLPRWPSHEVVIDLRLTPDYIEAQEFRAAAAEFYGNYITIAR